jgi:hypothetical protein
MALEVLGSKQRVTHVEAVPYNTKLTSPLPAGPILARQCTIAVPPSFSLRDAVCSFGFFMLSPNRWHDTAQSPGFLAGRLVRPLYVSKNGSGRPGPTHRE